MKKIRSLENCRDRRTTIHSSNRKYSWEMVLIYFDYLKIPNCMIDRLYIKYE